MIRIFSDMGGNTELCYFLCVILDICFWTNNELGDEMRFLNTLRPRQNGRHFPDDIFKCIFVNKNVFVLIKISLNFVPNARIDKIPSLVQIMAWRRPGDKPLSLPMMVSLLKHICVTWPQWVNTCVSPQRFWPTKLSIQLSSKHFPEEDAKWNCWR